jgi:hypothetical protein
MVRVEVIIVGTGAVAWQGSDFAQQVARSVEWMSHSPAAYSKKTSEYRYAIAIK